MGWRSAAMGTMAVAIGLTGVSAAHGAWITRTASGVTAELTYDVERSITADLASARIQRLTVRSAKHPSQTFTAKELDFPFSENTVDRRSALVIRDVSGDGEPEVLLATFTGGAHCCDETRVVWWSPSAKRFRVTGAFWGNARARIQDLNRDGIPEFVGRDDRFAYLLNASYAGSVLPERAWAFRQGRFVEVTRRHPAVGRRSMNRAWTAYVRTRRTYPKERANALAAYLASAATVNRAQRKVAWRRAATAERGNGALLRAVKRQVVRLGYGVG